MDGSQLNTLPLSSYGAKSIDCICGKTHKISTRDILVGSAVSASIGNIFAKHLPWGSAIFVILDSLSEPQILKTIARMGYRVSSHTLVCDGNTEEQANQIRCDEDVRLVVGAGGADAANVSKLVAEKKGLPLILIASSPDFCMYLAPYVFCEVGLDRPIRLAPPIALIADFAWLKQTSDKRIAAGFGELISKLIALFDWQVAALIEGADYCPFIAEQALALIDSCLNTLEQGYRNTQETAALILEYNIRFSALLQLSEQETHPMRRQDFQTESSLIQTKQASLQANQSSLASYRSPMQANQAQADASYLPREESQSIANRCHVKKIIPAAHLIRGGEAQTTAGIEFLFEHEQRKLHLGGETRFVVAGILAKIYTAALNEMGKTWLALPPDNNLRAERAQEFLGIPQSVILGIIKRLSPQRLKLEEFKLKEYRLELLQQIAIINKKLSRATRVFRRLYRDCGLSLQNYLEQSDLKLCISLAPDLSQNFTLLTQMKNLGMLEEVLL